MRIIYILLIISLILITGCSYENIYVGGTPNSDGGKSCNSSTQCEGKCIVPLEDIGNPRCERYNLSRGCYSIIEVFYEDNTSFKCVD